MLVKVLLNSANDLSNQVAGSPLELEHALIILLLLVGLLSIRGKYKRYVPWASADQDQKSTGLMFVFPVSQVYGISKLA